MGADLAADGEHFVICTERSAAVFALDSAGGASGDEAVHRVRFPDSGQIEGCCYAGSDLILVNELGVVYRVSAEQLEADTNFVPPS